MIYPCGCGLKLGPEHEALIGAVRSVGYKLVAGARPI